MPKLFHLPLEYAHGPLVLRCSVDVNDVNLVFLTDQALEKLELPKTNYSRLWVLKKVLIILESPVMEQ